MATLCNRLAGSPALMPILEEFTLVVVAGVMGL
jgi:hypothetical protein